MTTWQATRQAPRRHHLDEWEHAMQHDPGELDPHPDGRDLLLGVLICLAVSGVTLYGLWRVLEWVLA